MAGHLMIPYALDRSGVPRYIAEAVFLNQGTRGECRVRAYEEHARGGKPFFGCAACSGHLYPRLSSMKRPHWAHIADENSKECPLAKGKALSTQRLDAILYGGRKEGPAHKLLIDAIVRMAELDRHVKRDSIAVGQYLPPKGSVGFGRYPDVQFETDMGRLVIEVQLSPITLHRLVDRAEFYRRENASLIWVTRAFDPRTVARTWLADVWASQGQAIFSLDDVLINEALHSGRVLFRRHVWSGAETSIVDLAELVKTPWHQSFKQQWRETAGNHWYQALPLTEKLLADLDLHGVEDSEAICHALNALFSIESWQPFGSGHKNPISVVHSYLNSENGARGARLIELALERYRPEEMKRRSTLDLLQAAKANADTEGIRPWGRRSAIAMLRTQLFPEWVIDAPSGQTRSPP